MLTKKHCDTPFLLILLAAACLAAPGRAEDDPAAPPPIISTTEECSADYHIAVEEGKKPSAAEDKKRETVGMGEEIDLEWTGKPDLVGNEDDISWHIIEGENLGSWDKFNEGKKKIRLIIHDELTPGAIASAKPDVKKNAIIVQAYNKALNTLSEKKTFTVAIPTHLTAKHKKNGGGRGEIADRTRYSDMPRDGNADRGLPGATAQLEVTIHPTNVSFKKIHLVEKDGDEDAQGNKQPDRYPSLGGPHYPSENWAEIKDGNRIIDTIGWSKPMATVREKLVEPDGQSWTWPCLFKIQSFCRQDIWQLQAVSQQFSIKWADPATKKAVHASVSKFNCTVSRDSQNGKHEFNPQDK